MMGRGPYRAALVPVVALIAGVALVVGGCADGGGAGGGSADGSGPSPAAFNGRVIGSGGPDSDRCAAAEGDQLAGEVTIFAAASLKEAFDDLRREFTEAHPCVHVPTITYAGSSTLAKQLQDGAPADVFASANEANMDKVADLVTDRHDFATNTLQIAVAPGNPKNITSLADLAKPDVITVLCAAPVPCGAASREALDAAGVELTPASEEQNVKAVLTKVTTGNADAGLVYATDVASAGGAADGVGFPEAAEAVNTYPIAVMKPSDGNGAAHVFVNWVLGTHGRTVLQRVGFGRP